MTKKTNNNGKIKLVVLAEHTLGYVLPFASKKDFDDFRCHFGAGYGNGEYEYDKTIHT